MRSNQRGYTLVEVVMYLAITGLVMVTLLAGTGTALNQRRYQDATNSLMGYVQDQYNLTSNINSSRDVTDTCSGNTVHVDPTNTVKRGMSTCTIVGRMLWSFSDADGAGIKVRQVVATEDAATLPLGPTDSDVKVLHDAKLVLALQEDIYRPEWGTRLVKPGTSESEEFSILIVRVPTTGVVHTYGAMSALVNPDALVGQLSEMKLCLDPVGLLGMSTKPAGVRIVSDAMNTSGVQFVAQGDCES